MKKILAAIIICHAVTVSLSAQVTTSTLSGVVNERKTETPIEGVAVLVRHDATGAIAYTLTREDGTYKEKKEAVIKGFLERMVQYIPEIEGNVEVTDLATPLTYERYCDTFEGSYMTHWLPGTRTYNAPIRYQKGLYFAGQRTSYSGGLPPAAISGRTAAQHLCRDFNVEFVSR